MGFAWSHTTYAMWPGIIFNFEDKWDLDYFLAHVKGGERITANDAWKSRQDFIRIYSSRCSGANKKRQKRIREWKNAVRLRNS